uniref:Uncharacterized protein n=1 Tax=viral metagenome TaxID=1070528 RepID=A0A6C0K8U7_9ZZZZ
MAHKALMVMRLECIMFEPPQFNSHGSPYELMKYVCGHEAQNMIFTCGMLSMLYHQGKRGSMRYAKYLRATKCVMRYTRWPAAVKHYILWNYRRRTGSDNEALTEDLDDLIRILRCERHRRCIRTTGRALRSVLVLEKLVPRDVAMLIAEF